MLIRELHLLLHLLTSRIEYARLLVLLQDEALEELECGLQLMWLRNQEERAPEVNELRHVVVVEDLQ
jgi:hypothetical protein